MPSSPSLIAVGRYASSDGAERAREHLIAAGIEPVEATEAAPADWHVKVPMERHGDAQRELEQMERGIIGRFF